MRPPRSRGLLDSLSRFRAISSSLTCGLVLLTLASGTVAQVPDWGTISADPGSLPGFDGPMAFDTVRGQMMLVTGGRTWEASGSTWRDVGPSPGGGLREGCMWYDPVRQHMCWFGGNQIFSPTDWTFTWSGSSWVRLLTPVSPPARGGAACAYDSARDRLVVFGGLNTGVYLQDTWEFDGTTWAPRNSTRSPSARQRHRMAYDSTRKRSLLFGGIGRTGLKGDTWEWDDVASTWIPGAGGPGAMAQPTLAFDVARRRTVLTSSQLISGTIRTTWEWDGVSWTPTQTNEPFFSAIGAAAYDTVRRAVVIAAADDAGFATRRWDGQEWRRMTPFGQASLREGVATGYCDTTQTIVRFGGGASNGLHVTSLTQEFRAGTWSSLQPAISPSARMDAAMAADGVGGLLLFGGRNPKPSGETWRWNGRTWQQLLPSTSPPPRFEHRMAFDSARGRVVLFGGNDVNSTALGDTWEWDGATWIRMPAPTAPPARANPAMAFDRARGRTVLFGGGGRWQAPAADLWEWDGSTWLARPFASGPGPRAYGQMTFDELRGVIIMTGGFRLGFMSLPTPMHETWQWDGQSWTQYRQNQPLFGAYDSAVYHRQLRHVVHTTNTINALSNREFGTPSIGVATAFGSGCAGGSGIPAISGVGVPRTNNTQYGLWLTGTLPSNIAFVGLDTKSTSIPLNGSCTAYLPSAYLHAITTDLSGNRFLALPIPASPQLRGAVFFVQAVTLDPSGALGGVAALSAGLRIILD